VELGVVIGRGGSDIAAGDAMSHVAGYVVALDMTARELQEVAKKRGEPWSVAKGSDTGQLSRSQLQRQPCPADDQTGSRCARRFPSSPHWR
jgi:hypothetical protein